MKKKFKIIDTSTGQKIKLKEGEMIVMNDQGMFLWWLTLEIIIRMSGSCLMCVRDLMWNGKEKSDE